MKMKLFFSGIAAAVVLMFSACENCTTCTKSSSPTAKICGKKIEVCEGSVCEDTTFATQAEIDAFKQGLESLGYTCN